MGEKFMAKGLLTRGFSIHPAPNNLGKYPITKPTHIPAGTQCEMYIERNQPTIAFTDSNYKIVKVEDDWYCTNENGVWFKIEYDKNKPPYPISYFDKAPKIFNTPLTISK